jgi:hypothetical protein
LNYPAIFTNPRPCFQKRDLPAGETTVMNEFIADRAAGPPAAQQRGIPIEALFTHLTLSGLDPKEHRLPFAARFSDAHGNEYSGAVGGNTSERISRFVPKPHSQLLIHMPTMAMPLCQSPTFTLCLFLLSFLFRREGARRSPHCAHAPSAKQNLFDPEHIPMILATG